MNENWDIVRVLRHSRHDWLNRIQLIKGYLALGDIDKVSQLIDSFVQESRSETEISNVSMDAFVSYLLKYNWEGHSLLLEYDIEGTPRNLSMYDQELYHFTKSFFEVVEKDVDMLKENHMSITIEISEDDVRFFFDFRGKLHTDENVEQWLDEYSHLQHLFVSHVNRTEEEIMVTISEKAEAAHEGK